MAELQVVEVPIDECDLEMFDSLVQRNNTFSWIFEDQNGVSVKIQFMSQDEHDTKGENNEI